MVDVFNFPKSVINVKSLGKYCRLLFYKDTNKTVDISSNKKSSYNFGGEYIVKKLNINQQLLSYLVEIDEIKFLIKNNYIFRDDHASLIKWRYDGKAKGPAGNYHTDGNENQVSLMLIMEDNLNFTHMRIIPDSKNSLPHKIYKFLSSSKISLKGLNKIINLLYKFNDFIIEKFYNYYKLEGKKDTLFIFNASNCLHRVFPIQNTTRIIFHLNLVLYKKSLSKDRNTNYSNLILGDQERKLIGIY